ncbi:MAG: hypothetical protein IT323_19115, partial [Anaerolineae bacterium]|nr:hypothetical protein [Anaerolineae bacterium]
MADSIQNQLDRAFNLIQQEKLPEAVGLLRQVLAAQPNNADAWWLMANAVTEPEAAFDALSNVLRLNPLHEEAREAYDQLVAEYPQFVAPTSPDEFSPDVPVDIDDLLRRTGPLDQRRNDPLSRPQDGIDVSSAYLDEIWEQRQTAGASEATGNADLDALFGGGEMRNVPATPTEEEDLTALFSGRAPASVDDGLREEDLDADGGFTEEDFGLDTTEEDLEKFFKPDIPDEEEIAAEVETPATVAEPEVEEDLEKFFAPADDATASTEPARVEAMDETAAVTAPRPLFDPFAEREPGFVEEATGGEAAPAEPKPRRERRPRTETAPVVVTGPLGPEDLERPVNRRRNPLPRLILLVAAVAIVVGVAYLLLMQNQPVTAPGPAAADALAADLRDAGYQEPSSVIENGVFQVKFCALPGPDLQAKAYEAMSKIAARAAEVRDQVQNAQIEVKTCGADQVLYRASAPISALTSFVDSAGDARTFRASWQP